MKVWSMFCIIGNATTLLLSGCSGTERSTAGSSVGGSNSLIGGTTAANGNVPGGDLGVGGNGSDQTTSTGGASTSGMSTSSGVSSGGAAAGGATANERVETGGVAPGGTVGAGGARPTGGRSGIGGKSGLGGAEPTGGVSTTGGKVATGGVFGSGGAAPTGGRSAFGGTPGAGGTSSGSTGGAVSLGGNSSSTTSLSVNCGGTAGSATCPEGVPAMCGMLEEHNKIRAAAPGADPAIPPLVWDCSIAATAQTWADTCPTGHSGTSGLGENIYWYGGTQLRTPAQVVAAWAGESASYDYATNSCSGAPFTADNFAACGHYTQLVWRTTTRVGCGYANNCSGSGRTQPWVCNYAPPGNVYNGKTGAMNLPY